MWIFTAELIMVSYEPNWKESIKTSNRQANAMAVIVRMDRLGFRQMFRHAILTSTLKTGYLLGFLKLESVKRLSGRSSLKVSSL